ncbi:MAG TPA: LysM peptidoglycan-binding domain-containing protein, partial [Acidimicrobiales bacterium]|nr:LysM peptidoglycan-binding domain-containing protein [Acidimicrobiales bacterium]
QSGKALPLVTGEAASTVRIRRAARCPLRSNPGHEESWSVHDQGNPAPLNYELLARGERREHRVRECVGRETVREQYNCAPASEETSRVVQRRRRFVLGVLAAALLAALALPWGGAGGQPLVLPGSAQAGSQSLSPHSIYVVRPGDTLWSIAERLDPGGDPRPVVAQLSARLHGDTLIPGQALRLP